ncbi:MAG: replication-associated recombination protein A [bacterium]|nr:replication-associated recombination protein A [bacterium]
MMAPLADRIRPKTIDEVFGQKHLIDKDKPLYKIIEAKQIPNMIFYGPSGVGKTTVAEIIAKTCGKKLCKMNATSATTADIKQVISSRGTIGTENGILLYLDEIQYFTKKQQQILLEYIENGEITLIASTTENPYFYIYNAILSRCTVFEFKQLDSRAIIEALMRACEILKDETGCKIVFENEKTVEKIARASGGDVRKALNCLELCALTGKQAFGEIKISDEFVEETSHKSAMRYDRAGDEHYDIMSAYQKSMRGSDPDAAVHYLARLLEAGDLPSACRRLMVCACEDVGLANPQIIPIVKAAIDAALMVGMPEARIPLADATILVAVSPKSNSAYEAINAATQDIVQGNSDPIPRCLQNKHFDGDENKNKGQFYKYPHAFENHYVKQQYLPDALKDTVYYKFGDNKYEQQHKNYWDKIKSQN